MIGVFPPLEVLRRRRRNTELYWTNLDGRDCLVFVVIEPDGAGHTQVHVVQQLESNYNSAEQK